MGPGRYNEADLKNYSKNPRRITKAAFKNLSDSMLRLGDLSGIVHDLNSDQLIGGNQRGSVIKINECEIQLVEQYAEPDEQGTVAWGFVIWNGKKYNYRAVRWTEEQCEEANIQANKAGGTWNFDVLKTEFNIEKLQEWGFEQKEFGAGLPGAEDLQPGTDPGVPEIGKLNPKWNKKRTVRFLSIRSWRAQIRDKEIALMKEIKASCQADYVRAVAGEFQEAILGMVKSVDKAFITSAPRGHSKGEKHFIDEVGRELAGLLGCEYVKVFDDRDLKGSTHPRNWSDRGEIKINAEPDYPVCIFIDDISTSGTTVEVCVDALKQYFVLPIVWIYEDA